MRLSNKKSLIMIGVATVLTGFLTAILGECICRVFVEKDKMFHVLPKAAIDPYEGNPYSIGNRPFIYSHIPNVEYIQSHPSYRVSYKINSRGFRGPEITRTTGKGKKRIVLIGDSIVEGHGCEYDQTFASLMQNRIGFDGWEVINCGVQGASPIYYAANFERYAHLQPDAVLLFLYDNDIIEDRHREAYYFDLPWMASPGALVAGEKPSILLKSRLLYFLRKTWNGIGSNPYLTSELESIMKNNLSRRTWNKEQRSLDKISPFLVAPSLFDLEWTKTAVYLDYIVNKWEKKNVRVLVVSISLSNLGRNKPRVFDRHSLFFNHKVRDWARYRKLAFISLAPSIKDYLMKNDSQDIIIPNDGHPSPKGHEFIALSLKTWLSKRLD